MGLMRCEELIGLLGPRLLVVLGVGHGCTGIGPQDVDRYNAAQVRAAADHVFLRPGRGLEEAARGVNRADALGRIPERLRRVVAEASRGPAMSARGRPGGGFGR
jgi:hypothetical protein